MFPVPHSVLHHFFFQIFIIKCGSGPADDMSVDFENRDFKFSVICNFHNIVYFSISSKYVDGRGRHHISRKGQKAEN